VHLHFEIGTALRSANSSFLAPGSLVDPNTGYKSVMFESANPNANQSTTGVLKTDLFKGQPMMKTLQNYSNPNSNGQDRIIQNKGAEKLNEAGGF